MEHDFTLEQMQLIFTAITARFNEIAKLNEDYPEIRDIRTQYAGLLGIVGKVIADQRMEREMEKED